LSIPKNSSNKLGAFRMAIKLSEEGSQRFLTEKLKLPPVRKSILAQRHAEPFMDIFYREAIYASSFVDPD
jgi:hypothetical protein